MQGQKTGYKIRFKKYNYEST